METRKPNLNSEFFEDAVDPLAGFRKKIGGVMPNKNGIDPISMDPDVIQFERQIKLEEDIRNMGNLF